MVATAEKYTEFDLPNPIIITNDDETKAEHQFTNEKEREVSDLKVTKGENRREAEKRF